MTDEMVERPPADPRPAPQPRLPSMSGATVVRVVLWMTGALLSFSVVAVSIRGLAHVLSVFEILAIRTGSGLLVLSLLALVRPALRSQLATQRLGLHVARNVVHVGATYAWALSITLLPLATAFALEFTAPAWVALLAMLALRERVTTSRIGAVVLGFLGVMVILHPGLGTFQPASLVMLAAAVGFAISIIMTKKLTVTDSTFTILFWMNAIQFPITLFGSNPAFLTRLDGSTIVPALGVAIAGLASHFCLTNAFRRGDATIVVPLDFLRVPLIAIVGWSFYGEPLEALVFVGAAVIIMGILWNLRAETARA